MKRLILVLLVLLAGFSLAFAAVNPAQPPGAINAEVAVLMAGYGIHDGVVTQPTDIVLALPVMAELSILQSLIDNDIALLSDKATVKLRSSMINSMRLEYSFGNCADYHLRL